MRASAPRRTFVLLASVLATLRISIATMWDVLRGRSRRHAGDARLRWWSGRLLELADIDCRVSNPAGVRLGDGTATILMTNHASLYDIPLTFVAIPGSIRMLTKKELFRVPIWGRAMRAGEFISIDRHNRDRALEDLAAAREKMESGITLWIAPEGTRSKDGRLGPFKKGGFMLALETGARIVPVGIRGADRVLPPGTFGQLELGCTVEVHIGEPVDCRQWSLETRDEWMEEIATRISDLACVQRRDHDE